MNKAVLHSMTDVERLAAARSGSTGPDTTAGSQDGTVATGRARQTRKTTGGIKKDASSQAAGARRQAQRDARQHT